MLIGFPTALALNWIAFHYTERFPATGLRPLHRVASHNGHLWLNDRRTRPSDSSGIIPQGSYWRELQSSIPISLVITLVVGLSVTSYETLRHRLQDATLELRTRQVEQERANKLLVEARLSSLESRIHPHFLFNTLNSIASLIPTDPKRAEDNVGKLASLLRFSISCKSIQPRPARAGIEDRTRLSRNRIHPLWSASSLSRSPSPTALGDCKVPPLALQTLVENSVKHVAAQRNQPSTIRIDGVQHDGHLELSVTDDGPGFSTRRHLRGSRPRQSRRPSRASVWRCRATQREASQ